MFHAQLRLPANMPRQQRVQRVMNIIQELSLIKVRSPLNCLNDRAVYLTVQRLIYM
jgi:hypothetical protein